MIFVKFSGWKIRYIMEAGWNEWFEVLNLIPEIKPLFINIESRLIVSISYKRGEY